MIFCCCIGFLKCRGIKRRGVSARSGILKFGLKSRFFSSNSAPGRGGFAPKISYGHISLIKFGLVLGILNIVVLGIFNTRKVNIYNSKFMLSQ